MAARVHRRAPLAPAAGDGNVHVFDLGAAMEQFQVRQINKPYSS